MKKSKAENGFKCLCDRFPPAYRSQYQPGQSLEPDLFSESWEEKNTILHPHSLRPRRFIDPSCAPPGFHGLRQNSPGIQEGSASLHQLGSGAFRTTPVHGKHGLHTLCCSPVLDRGREVRQRQWRLKARPRHQRSCGGYWGESRFACTSVYVRQHARAATWNSSIDKLSP